MKNYIKLDDAIWTRAEKNDDRKEKNSFVISLAQLWSWLHTLTYLNHWVSIDLKIIDSLFSHVHVIVFIRLKLTRSCWFASISKSFFIFIDDQPEKFVLLVSSLVSIFSILCRAVSLREREWMITESFTRMTEWI